MAKAGENDRNVDVLMIDDQSVMRALIRDYLQSSLTNLTIVEAPDGARGIKLLIERNPRVVLMDINLPAANGIELAGRIKVMRPEIPVIMLTNLEGSAYVERARAAGAFGYVRKDKIYSDLIPLVVRALGAAPSHGKRKGDE